MADSAATVADHAATLAGTATAGLTDDAAVAGLDGDTAVTRHGGETAATGSGGDLADDVLVEEVSIDGMCGVY
jgi:mycofactocin precursor